MTPQITIDLREYDKLREDSEAFNKIKNGEKFIHFTLWETIGGFRTTITSNDKRVEVIKLESQTELERIVLHKNSKISALENELEEIKSRGFFKRLFS